MWHRVGNLLGKTNNTIKQSGVERRRGNYKTLDYCCRKKQEGEEIDYSWT